MKSGYRLILAIMLVSIILFSALPRETSAIPYKIEGYLKDSEGLPITLANITITGMVYDMGVQDYITKNFYVITDANGYYKIYLAAAEPGGYDQNSEVVIAYTAEDQTSTETITIRGLGSWANLTYDSQPTFGELILSPLGIITMVIIVTVIFFSYYIYRSSLKQEKDDEDETAPKRPERRRRQR